MKHPEDAILRIKRVRDSFGIAEPGNVPPGRPGLKETKDAIEACDWDEDRARALLIERGQAREHVHMRIVGGGRGMEEAPIDLWVPVNANFIEISAIIEPLVAATEPENMRLGLVRAKTRAVWETLQRTYGAVRQGDPGLPGPVQR